MANTTAIDAIVVGKILFICNSTLNPRSKHRACDDQAAPGKWGGATCRIPAVATSDPRRCKYPSSRVPPTSNRRHRSNGWDSHRKLVIRSFELDQHKLRWASSWPKFSSLTYLPYRGDIPGDESFFLTTDPQSFSLSPTFLLLPLFSATSTSAAGGLGYIPPSVECAE